MSYARPIHEADLCQRCYGSSEVCGECGTIHSALACPLCELAARMDAIERADPLEERLSALERQVAQMAAPPARQPRQPLATPPPDAPFVSTNDAGHRTGGSR